MKIRSLLLAGLAAATLALSSLTAVGQTLPQVQTIGPTDLFQDIVGGVPTAQNQYASALQLAGYSGTLPTRGNVLIGGDSTTNLYQRATTGSSVTTTLTYGGPDRWAYWSGTGTAITLSRTTTAADIPASGFASGFKLARTAAQTGVVQSCMMQVVETANSYQFAGQTAELSFYATAGSTFSAASGNITAYIIYGTGTNEGAAAAAFGLNAGGGGGAGWTGQANATAAVIPITTANNRYVAVATVPATATELAVALCFTPVGTAGANDYVAFSGIQLVRNSALASKVDVDSGYICGTGSTATLNPVNCTAFDRRPQGLEASLQYRYFYKVTETSAIFPFAPCAAIDVTHTNCLVAFPVPMRIAPTMTYANGFATPTSTTQATLGACNTLASAATVTSTVAATTAVLVNCTATTIPAAGVASFLYSNNGTGAINANAEL